VLYICDEIKSSSSTFSSALDSFTTFDMAALMWCRELPVALATAWMVSTAAMMN
jgi:hypothetical protein